ncbi:flavin reductase [Xaviernesmea oryzae]|uniref:Flavin reductase n=1 Tax=Xaviernesmea oryzae TaxID=464029 RepID=A0A1Q9AYZ9_9HYPH|nr:flavin reductase family protein [Xaviernesmea oryzae]OLP60917.1 flavin reductase [Xaviernesmea oryzae]SEL21847.1 NADH-FMN oxidoreductase RutF, flavin reductase (DIM6/NTAB) family [Xaviernesmea oryzae]
MSDSSFDPRALRDAFGAFATGVTVVTARDGVGQPLGFTANSFTSVSLDPPLLLVCLAKTSRNYQAMTTATHFAVNILSETQKDVSNTFARPVEDRFATVSWQAGGHGCPLLADVSAWFECARHELVDAGDHVILIGRVLAFDNSGRNGLGYARGGYFTPMLAGKAVSAASEGAIELGTVLERDGEILLLGDDLLRLPACMASGGNPTETLKTHLEALTGLPVTIGFLYSVYENKASGQQHIVYRAFAGPGVPAEGQFIALERVEPDRLQDPASRDIVRRFAAESTLGNFGVYFGSETAGRIHSISMGGAQR